MTFILGFLPRQMEVICFYLLFNERKLYIPTSVKCHTTIHRTYYNVRTSLPLLAPYQQPPNTFKFLPAIKHSNQDAPHHATHIHPHHTTVNRQYITAFFHHQCHTTTHYHTTSHQHNITPTYDTRSISYTTPLDSPHTHHPTASILHWTITTNIMQSPTTTSSTLQFTTTVHCRHTWHHTEGAMCSGTRGRVWQGATPDSRQEIVQRPSWHSFSGATFSSHSSSREVPIYSQKSSCFLRLLLLLLCPPYPIIVQY